MGDDGYSSSDLVQDGADSKHCKWQHKYSSKKKKNGKISSLHQAMT